ncbi:MAG: hypothetical protein D3924_19270 [Candidatus Electrothrix sp. AR4]|nr:hypothetical protein [Candidatus Electrothrix sp. AR4]
MQLTTINKIISYLLVGSLAVVLLVRSALARSVLPTILTPIDRNSIPRKMTAFGLSNKENVTNA